MFNVLFLNLFSYMQYVNFIVNWLQNLALYGILMLSTNFIVSTINYALTRKSYQKIKQMAEKKHLITVLRGGARQQIYSTELVPGDVYFPQDTVPCDSIIARHDLFANEVGFTGENIPIGKFALTDTSKVYESEHWAFEGS
jgi:P-type E1-E2 ATPase